MRRFKNIFHLPGLLSRLFNKSNLNKVVIIFTIGFVSRILVNYVYDINVYFEYLNIISILYYIYMACFLVLVHELITYFDFSIIPSFSDIIYTLKELFNKIFRINNILFYSKYLKIDNLNLSLIKKGLKELTNKVKQPFYLTEYECINSRERYIHSIDSTKKVEISTVLNKDNDNNSNSNNKGITYSGLGEQNNYNNTPASLGTDFGFSRPYIDESNGPLFVIDTLRGENGGSMPLATPNVTQTNNFNPSQPNLVPTPLFAPRQAPYISSSIYSENQGFSSQDSIAPIGPPSLAQCKISDIPSRTHPALYAPNLPAVPSETSLNTNKSTSVVTNPNTSFEDSSVLSGYRNQTLAHTEEGIIATREITIQKEGLAGKFNLGFKYLDNKVNNSLSKLESIYVKYHDKAKRKFFWTIWEKRYGNYESYEQFKRLWDPNTNIWKEIAGKTNTDVSRDIGGLFGVNSNNRDIQSSERREIDKAVSNLLRNNRPFARPVEDNISGYPSDPSNNNDNSNDSHNRSHSRRHNHTHSRRHRHYHGHRHGHINRSRNGS